MPGWRIDGSTVTRKVVVPAVDVTPLLTVTDACPPSLTASVPDAPRLPDGAGFPQPVTPEERTAVGAYLEWLAGFGAHDKAMTTRAAAGKAWCEARSAPAPTPPLRRWWRVW